MSNINIYTTENCSYCVRAKQLLDRKGAAYKEIRVDSNPELRDEMITRAGGRRTVPQIFINDQHIGGCDDLMTLEMSGELDILLR